jgi:ectoine hydroxylase-related dioxygenase (phytanoyl-CoA dioxygenase family)
VDWPYHQYNTNANDLNILYPGTQIEGVQCILPLDDFTIENGATMYIPFSHLARRYPTVEILEKGSFTTVNQDRYPCKKKYFVANVGDVILYPATLWHSAGLNTTTKPRRSLLANFSPTHVSKKDFGI